MSIRNHCVLSKKAIEWIDGELLGDGCLYSRGEGSASFSYSTKHLEYAQYVIKMIESFGIAQSGKIHKRMGGFNTPVYRCASRFYVELFPLWIIWYLGGKKAIPKVANLLTPLVCRQWYIGDGSLYYTQTQKPYIKLATCGFSVDDVEWLVEQLWEISIVATRQPSKNIIYISTHSTPYFLKYIGECPVECYKYKWDYNN